MAELKPCPFCGNKEILLSISFGWMHGVMCGKCGAEFTKCETLDEAETRWNRRVDNG